MQVWFKNRRAKVRQQATHQQSANVSSLKTSNRSTASSSSTTSSTRHSHSNNASASSGNSNTNNNNNNNSKSSGTGMSSGGITKTTSSMKHTQGTTSSSNSNHLTHHHNNNNNNNNNNSNTNGLSAIGHNSSPILPMTPTSSVSPPVNVICKKEVSGYHTGNVPGNLSDVMKTTSIHDSIKDEMGMSHNPAAYSNINARLGQGGNLTPLGSNSSIMTTPSPPITPSQNAFSYVPNHDAYLWHQQYNQYANNYNPPASHSYYPQMDYQSQSNYSMGHSSYPSSNIGLSSGASFNGSMGSQAFASNSIEYMAQQDKYINMV